MVPTLHKSMQRTYQHGRQESSRNLQPHCHKRHWLVTQGSFGKGDKSHFVEVITAGVRLMSTPTGKTINWCPWCDPKMYEDHIYYPYNLCHFRWNLKYMRQE